MIVCVLDHVAIAVERTAEAWPRYVGDLGGEWLGGGVSSGFSSSQVRYANGMKLEMLAPHAVEENDFLRRFLDASGPGPHHLTYKVPDLRLALDEAEAAGFDPVGVDFSEEDWQEAFLHPKQAHGVVVQIAHSNDGEWTSPAPADLPTPSRATATLEHVAHEVADLEAATALFAGLLGGRTTNEGDGWVELTWSGAGRVRLMAASVDQLNGRPGRVHHLAYRLTDPASVPDARPAGDRFEVPPDRNLGTRLFLTDRQELTPPFVLPPVSRSTNASVPCASPSTRKPTRRATSPTGNQNVSTHVSSRQTLRLTIPRSRCQVARSPTPRSSTKS